MKNCKFKIFTFLLSTCYLLLATISASAQTTSQFLVSWQAESYVPSWYQGKVLATKGSAIKVSFELIDSGKIVNLSKKKVRWYINDKLVQNENNGLGLKFYSFIADDYPGQDTEIRITIVDYKDEVLDKIIVIPIVSSEAVIDAPYPNREIKSGKNSFFAYPFFFNIKDLNKLSFEWLVDNQAAEAGDNSAILDLNVDSLAPKGFGINVKLTIKNLLDELSFASKNIETYVQ